MFRFSAFPFGSPASRDFGRIIPGQPSQHAQNRPSPPINIRLIRSRKQPAKARPPRRWVPFLIDVQASGRQAPCYGFRVSRKGLSPNRLEAFSDGVIAVIITIMVLELKVPGPDGVAGLRAVLPTVFLYLLTFVQIGIYWVNHHYLVDEVKTVSHGILWANLMFLFCLSLFPFATDWIGIKGLSSFTTALYAAVSIFPGLGYMALWTQIRASEWRAKTRKLGQADRVGFALSHGDSRGLLSAGCIPGSNRNRCVPLAVPAKV